MFQTAKPDSLIGQLYLGMDYLDSPRPHPCDTIPGVVSRLNSSGSDFVAIMDLNTIHFYIDHLTAGGTRRVEVFPKPLLSYGLGLIFPNKSELRDEMSKVLLKLSDSGHLEKFRNIRQSGGDAETTRSESSNSGLSLQQVLPLLLFSAFALTTSGMVLLVELLISGVKRRREFSL